MNLRRIEKNLGINCFHKPVVFTKRSEFEKKSDFIELSHLSETKTFLIHRPSPLWQPALTFSKYIENVSSYVFFS